MNLIRTVIVDDEFPARKRIRSLLEKLNEVSIVAECPDGRTAVDFLRQNDVDLVFLDIRMPEMSGMEVVECLNLKRPPVFIFVTAFDSHAIRAFELEAVDYLLKPFDESRFLTAFQRAKKHMAIDLQSPQNDSSQLELLANGLPTENRCRRLLVKSHGNLRLVDVADIDRIEASGKYVRLHCGESIHLHRKTMKRLQALLEPENFVRIHRSHIVNLERIRQIQPMFHGDYVVILKDGTELPLSRNYMPQLRQRFDEFN